MEFVSIEAALHNIKWLGFYVKDAGLLDSALSRPKTTLFGEYAYPSLQLMAAAMHQSLVKNHPLVDGNKRSSWLLLNVFLELNGQELQMTTEEGLDFTLGVAEGRYDLEASAAIIAKHLTAAA
ncbi:MAG: type II toxin-antitoxin system death-on-curing family toxin [Rhodoluna sp.]|nr:type II toxin-antitoxin system death-on-curing family toxin [Rhodoluna sp.]